MSRPAAQASAIPARKSFNPDSKQVLATFNTWAYKREQPSDLDLLFRTIDRAMVASVPIPYVLYWGKGPRHHLAQPDEECLGYLAGMAERIKSVYPAGAAIELLLTDTHARLNRHDDAAINAYYGDVAKAAASHGFTTRRLSEVATSLLPGPPVSTEGAADPYVLDQLTTSASKWYGGDGSARCGAIQYYAINMTEKRAVGAAYPHAIFVTFNNSKFRVLFPDNMPIFYMYSLRKGFAVKPWFIDAA